MLSIYAALAGATVYLGQILPTGFIPLLDRGYAIVVIQLPDSASLSRTDDVVQRASEIIQATPGVKDAVAFAGFSGATFTNAPNSAVIFAGFTPFAERIEKGLSSGAVIGDLFGRLQGIQEAFIIAIPPPAVPGIGNAGGFKMQVQNRADTSVVPALAAAYDLVGRAQAAGGLVGVFTTFSASSPQIYLQIDRVKAQMLNVPIANIFETLQVNLGSTYVNDFNAFGRLYQVVAQADQRFRLDREDILQLKVRSSTGALVPLGTLIEIRDVAGPDLVQRYNMLPSVPIQGNAAPGMSSGQALEIMERLAGETLGQGLSYEWTELSLQQKLTGNTAAWIFALSVLFVFLALAAQYESWGLPLAIILIVPMSALSALLGVMARGMDNNILVQIGLVVLVGLAAKNSILIVEFARQLESQGRDVVAAVIEAARLRLRPILMTALAFILGVVPLVIAVGPGAEMRQALGTAVFAGMLGVTVVGLLLTPVFYVTIRMLTRLRIGAAKQSRSVAERNSPETGRL
jgi:HAE1 family hydrophobic/amphiphilic exporter-1